MHGPPKVADLFADLDPQALLPVLERALVLSLEAVRVLGSSRPCHAWGLALTAEPSVATDVGKGLPTAPGQSKGPERWRAERVLD